jgi:PKHD-type hydroxylase
MLVVVPDALSAAQLAEARRIIDAAPWVDGRVTAGHQSAKAKFNLQIPEDHPAAVELGESILSALAANPLFVSAALPLKIFPPLFNRYSGGQYFGTHVDNAIRKAKGNPERVRADISVTLFLSEPTDYDGGELTIESSHGARSVKLPAGQLVLYPSSSLHHVSPVTRGTRTCAFFWIQSLVRESARREILFDLDTSIQRLSVDHPGHPSSVALVGVYHNLLRQWADT